MINRVWLINSLLLVLICVLAVNTYDLWVAEDHMTAGAAPQKSEKRSKPAINHEKPAPVKEKSHYQPVVKKNLFFPDRTGHIEKASSAGASTGSKQQKPSEFENYIILYGVTMTGEEKTALISNPNPEKGGRKTLWVAAGDHIRGRGGSPRIEIKEIHKDKIILSVRGKSYDCEMYKDRSKSSATVQTGHVEKTPSSPSLPPSRQVKQPPTEISPDGKYRIIKTPFGKIKRRIN